MRKLIALALFTTPVLAHPPQSTYAPPPPAPSNFSIPAPARQTRQFSMPEQLGDQIFIDRPVVDDVFIRERRRQRVTWLAPVDETNFDVPSYSIPPASVTWSAPMPSVQFVWPQAPPRRDIEIQTGLFGHVRRVRVGETEVRVGPFGKFRGFRSRD